MNETEPKTSDSTELADLKAQCGALRRQNVLLLVALFVVSGTLTVFLGMQSRILAKNLANLRPEAQQVVDRSQREEPVISAFMTKLADYGRTHPGFAPIMNKYGLSTNPAAYKTNSAASILRGATPSEESTAPAK
jgi:hypothetical protein